MLSNLESQLENFRGELSYIEETQTVNKYKKALYNSSNYTSSIYLLNSRSWQLNFFKFKDKFLNKSEKFQDSEGFITPLDLSWQDTDAPDNLKYFTVKYRKRKKRKFTTVSKFSRILYKQFVGVNNNFIYINRMKNLITTRVSLTKIWKTFHKYSQVQRLNTIKRVSANRQKMIYLHSRTKKPFTFRNIGMFLWSQKNSFFKKFLKIKYLLRKNIYSFIYPNEIRKLVINRRRAIKSYKFMKDLNEMKLKKKVIL